MSVNTKRVRDLNAHAVGAGPVVYWMSRDQRVEDNWALLYAKEQAETRGVPFFVAFNLFLIKERANTRQYEFMFAGLKEVEDSLRTLNIPFFLLEGETVNAFKVFAAKHSIGEVVVDFNPLRHARARRIAVAQALSVRVCEVDAHNIVPCWVASDKQEFAAYTFRPKVHKALPEYLTTFPRLTAQMTVVSKIPPLIDWERVLADMEIVSLPSVTITSGAKAAHHRLREFITLRLDTYHEDRNDPTKNGVSGLSPYLHFGQISAQRVAYEVAQAFDSNKDARDAFLEELIVRKELADNYCFYNEAYDTVAGAHAWAQKTIDEHKHDKREYLYTKEQLEGGETHDDLWNAMQQQMVQEGKMHGWCRMYWAKKILEWTPDAQTAVDIALYLNDKYELDGLDPNGVAGVMWSICGVHDRAWNERHIFGKIRYMNYAGAKRKFDIKAYIARYEKKQSLFE
jgi:deoxyribodipyrimidine photo-lyase